jgi:hypothetical protein
MAVTRIGKGVGGRGTTTKGQGGSSSKQLQRREGKLSGVIHHESHNFHIFPHNLKILKLTQAHEGALQSNCETTHRKHIRIRTEVHCMDSHALTSSF